MSVAAADALMGVLGYKRVEAICLRPMHVRPREGSRITVMMRDGKQLECLATRVIVIYTDQDGIVIYNGRKPIDESNAVGWWPMAKVAK